MNILGLSHLAPSPFGHDSSVALLDDDLLFLHYKQNTNSKLIII